MKCPIIDIRENPGGGDNIILQCRCILDNSTPGIHLNTSGFLLVKTEIKSTFAQFDPESSVWDKITNFNENLAFIAIFIYKKHDKCEM